MTLNVFIGWSGWRSYLVARKLTTWLKEVIPGVEPWMSEDISSGKVAWFENELNPNLRRAEFAVMCVSPENWHNPWFAYEAGVVFGQTERERRICPYITDRYGLRRNLPEPLKFFWAEKADHDGAGTLKMVKAINKAAGSPLSDEGESDELTRVFWEKWPDLLKVLQEATPPPPLPPSPGLADYIDDFMKVSRCIETHQFRLYGRFRDLIDRAVASLKAGTYDREALFGLAADEIHRSKERFADEPSLLVGNVSDFFAEHYNEGQLRDEVISMESLLGLGKGRPRAFAAKELEAVRETWVALMRRAVLEVFSDYHSRLVDSLKKFAAAGDKKEEDARKKRGGKKAGAPKKGGKKAGAPGKGGGKSGGRK